MTSLTDCMWILLLKYQNMDIHGKSHYLLAVIYNSVIKLLYYFVKKCLGYFYSSNISSSHLSVLKAFQVPPFRCRKFSGPPQIMHPSPPLVIYERSLIWSVLNWRFANISRMILCHLSLQLFAFRLGTKIKGNKNVQQSVVVIWKVQDIWQSTTATEDKSRQILFPPPRS